MSYDDHQKDAPLLICAICGRKFFATRESATQKGWICLQCRSMDAKPKRMDGVVVAFDGGFYEVDCADAPAYLRPLFLRPWQARGVSVGSAVVLEYQTTARSGLWNVVSCR